MICRVKLFARARDLLQRDEVTITLSENATVGELRRALGEEYPSLRGLLEHSALAVDNSFVEENDPVNEGAEIALLPPVSGG